MKYFTIGELTNSATAKSLNVSNSPSLEVVENLTRLIETILDPLREAYGHPVTVTSGFRTPELNKILKGSPTSQHVRGEAADLI